jgi:hypothetical protein
MSHRIYTLNAGLVSYWPLVEASGSRYDQTGAANTLTNNNAVTQTTISSGPGVYASSFASASSQYLSIADNALVSTGDIDYTICCWVNITSTGADRVIMSKWATAGSREYYLYYANTGARFALTVSGDGTASTTVSDAYLTPSTSTWYFVRAWHDATGNTLNIQTNLNTVNSTAHTTGSYDSTTTLLMGALGPAAPSLFMNGQICQVGFWKRVLTAQEHAWLYNNGRGRTYPFVTTPQPDGLGRGIGSGVRRNRSVGMVV